jgi:hypothetical protein
MYTMHLLPSVTIQPNLELKTRPKQLLGSLPLVIALPAEANITFVTRGCIFSHVRPFYEQAVNNVDP